MLIAALFRYDIVVVELSPSQEYRSSILSGLKPEIIMEICTRAISFWTYQISQEAKYQELTQRGLEDKVELYEKQQQRMTREVNVELNVLQGDLEQEKRKTADLSEQLDQMSRQLSRLQTLYERQKRRPLFYDALQHAQPVHDRNPTLLNSEGNQYRLYQSSYKLLLSLQPKVGIRRKMLLVVYDL
ncbi:cyclin B1 interacting protein 1, E3 ubiquitin protein ligase [Dissophora globulifera]|nr:cyclin B1 interacting protein 1, E3 ubiquitin protein ligase [Dissophora globulifera]